jgi:glycosyltransferase involved in cell wall biosynthesis
MLRVLLIANYALDRQQSMTRVANLLESGLRSIGLNVQVIRPPVFFGRILRSQRVLNKWLGYLDKFLLFPLVLIRRARSCELVHIIDHSNAVYRFWLGSRKTVVNCNDLLAVRSALGEFSEHRTAFTGKIFQRWILAGLRRAERIACISEATREDVLRLLQRSPKEVTRVYLGLGKLFQAELEQNLTRSTSEEVGTATKEVFLEQRAVKVRTPYILHVGGAIWYKNRDRVLHIYSIVRTRFSASTPDLIMVGPPMRSTGESVLFLEEVAEQDLLLLYRNAKLLLFPSLYEGFGFPVIEAQACGCPVVTTRRAPLTEIGGDAATYIADPLDASAAAEAVLKILRFGQSEREQMRKRGLLNASRFSERAMIEGYVDLYDTFRAE